MTTIDVRAHAAECGSLDCGHLARSTDQATRRAVILYACQAAGAPVQDDRESADVLTVLAVLREAQTAPQYVRRGSRYAETSPAPGVTVLPDTGAMIWSPERVEVATLYAQGLSARQIGVIRGRSIDTIVSHFGWLRRRSGGHSMLDVIVSAVTTGRIPLYVDTDDAPEGDDAE